MRSIAAGAAGSPQGSAVGAVIVVVAAVCALSARTVARNEDWTSNRSAVDERRRRRAGELQGLQGARPRGDGVRRVGRTDRRGISLASRSIGIIERANLPLLQQPAGLYAEAGSYHLRKAQALAASAPGAGQPEFARAIALLQRAESIDQGMNREQRQKQLAAGRAPEQVHDLGSAFIYKMLATAYLGANEPLRAVAAAEYLQRLSPNHFDPHFTRGIAEASAAQFESARGDGAAAREHLSRAAVNLIAATILNPWHREPWPVLAQVYQYLEPTPPAVALTAEGGSLNPKNPQVVRDVQLACIQLLSQMRAAGLDAEAAAARTRMINELGIPPAVLDAGTKDGRVQ